MKREARLLRNKALDSLLLAVEHFNRPYDRGRVATVLILLDHSRRIGRGGPRGDPPGPLQFRSEAAGGASWPYPTKNSGRRVPPASTGGRGLLQGDSRWQPDV